MTHPTRNKTSTEVPFDKKIADANGNITLPWLQFFGIITDFCNNKIVSWTPEITASTTAPTITYSTQSGHYMTIGSLVWVSLVIVVGTVSGGTGDLQLTLPITTHDDSDRARFAILASGVNWGATTQIVARTNSGTKLATIAAMTTDVEVAALAIGAIAAGDTIGLSGFYMRED